MRKEIVEAIISLLKADSTISGKVKEQNFYFGVPPAPKTYPFIAVRWAGDTLEDETVKKRRAELQFTVTIVDYGVIEDEVEKNVTDLVDAVCNVVKNNPTLNGTVDYARVTRAASDVEIQGNYALVGAEITITARKVE